MQPVGELAAMLKLSVHPVLEMLLPSIRMRRSILAPTGCCPPTARHPQKEAEGLCATALREVMLLKALSHPNIMSLEAIHMLPAELALCLAFPYAETGAAAAWGAGCRSQAGMVGGLHAR